MPSVMSKENELLTKDYQAYLEGLGYTVIYYIKDDYPSFGQLNRIREKILASSAMVAFGFKSTMPHSVLKLIMKKNGMTSGLQRLGMKLRLVWV